MKINEELISLLSQTYNILIVAKQLIYGKKDMRKTAIVVFLV